MDYGYSLEQFYKDLDYGHEIEFIYNGVNYFLGRKIDDNGKKRHTVWIDNVPTIFKSRNAMLNDFKIDDMTIFEVIEKLERINVW